MVKVFVCGDIVNYENHSGLVCSDALAEIISNADYSICNFEAPIEGIGQPVPKSGIHHFQRKATIEGLKVQGFDLLCLANNHIMDFGPDALQATIDEAKRHHLETIGAGIDFHSAYQPIIKKFEDVTIGFINACEAQFGVLDNHANQSQPGYAWLNHHFLDLQILKLKEECDYVIVLAHAGLEHYSIPQKEWRLKYKHLCDLGADIIIGSHPHVPQGYELYNQSVIFYSLGNFYFDSKNFKHKEDNTYSVLLNMTKENINFELIYHHKENGKVHLSPKEKQINITELNEKLENGYNKLVDEMSLQVFNKIIKHNLIYSLGDTPYNGSFISTVKHIIATILGRRSKVDKDLLSLHLLRNETYYYAAKHALQLKANEKHGRRSS
ncbi:CapA family protein [Pallidibacillus thermolactis]|uniref:CapA family protein n=1 Tax=Pallidibacillus thermolactis TaxID=251051 RepID=UPI002E2337EB|nr:CapA family protein [Pallidibacillus thermolactis subsp. kokeshiiformis]